MKRILLLFLCAAFPAPAQEFEVVSIKPNNSGSNSSHTRSDDGLFTAINLSLRQLIVQAYGMKDYQIEGPDWLADLRFDLSARFPEKLSFELKKDQEKYAAAIQTMMQKMLADRFKLEAHRSQKNFSVYGLVVAKSGIRFKVAEKTDSHNSNSDNNHYTGQAVSMEAFCAFLSRRADLPVIT